MLTIRRLPASLLVVATLATLTLSCHGRALLGREVVPSDGSGEGAPGGDDGSGSCEAGEIPRCPLCPAAYVCGMSCSGDPDMCQNTQRQILVCRNGVRMCFDSTDPCPCRASDPVQDGGDRS